MIIAAVRLFPLKPFQSLILWNFFTLVSSRAIVVFFRMVFPLTYSTISYLTIKSITSVWKIGSPINIIYCLACDPFPLNLCFCRKGHIRDE